MIYVALLGEIEKKSCESYENKGKDRIFSLDIWCILDIEKIMTFIIEYYDISHKNT